MTQHRETGKGTLAHTGRGTCSEQVWNITELLQRLDGDKALFCELLQIFHDDHRENLQNAKSALADKDFPRLMRTAHTLKGMFRNLSMNRAAEAAHALENASRQENGKEAEEFLAQVEQAAAELLPEVDAQMTLVET